MFLFAIFCSGLAFNGRCLFSNGWFYTLATSISFLAGKACFFVHEFSVPSALLQLLLVWRVVASTVWPETILSCSNLIESSQWPALLVGGLPCRSIHLIFSFEFQFFIMKLTLLPFFLFCGRCLLDFFWIRYVVGLPVSDCLACSPPNAVCTRHNVMIARSLSGLILIIFLVPVSSSSTTWRHPLVQDKWFIWAEKSLYSRF